MNRVLLAGVLADPRVLDALGRMPALPQPAGDMAAAVPVPLTPRLARLADILGLSPQQSPAGRVLTLESAPDLPFRDDPALVAELVRDLTASPDLPVATMRRRLPMMAWRAASRLRAMAERGLPLRPGPPVVPGESRVRIEAQHTPYADYFAVEDIRLRHRLHRGGWSAPLNRAVFVSGDAVVVLPWDPRRDRVLLVDQFRVGPAARGDAQPWLHEPVAGRVDAGETPETTARREAMEEAGVTLDRLFPVPGHYPSPGIIAEYIYGFVGTADLPDDAAIVSGLASEGEDIRGHLVTRADLTAMALDGRIANGPLIILALWLDRMAPDLRARSR